MNAENETACLNTAQNPDRDRIVNQLIDMRLIQIIINEHNKNGAFRIPIHLALGHEAIAIATANSMQENDRLILSHRNIHYNIARGATLKSLLQEFLLEKDGLAGGVQGAMNLTNPRKGIPYTSSILGNNFGVGTGIGLALKNQGKDGLAIIVTGDGAMEEGSFYESLLMLAGQEIPSIIIVENNEWSLASTIDERRKDISVKSLAHSTQNEYALLEGNNVFEYIAKMNAIRQEAVNLAKCFVVEVRLKTLGDWILTNDENPDGKFINYHAGAAPTIHIEETAIIQDNAWDPLAVVAGEYEKQSFAVKIDDLRSKLLATIS